MHYGDVRDEWRISAVERQAREASDKASSLDWKLIEVSQRESATSRSVDNLEYTVRELSALVDELRSRLERAEDELATVKAMV